jgi:hypothetical protein
MWMRDFVGLNITDTMRHHPLLELKGRAIEAVGIGAIALLCAMTWCLYQL